jgi:hypothetical protein
VDYFHTAIRFPGSGERGGVVGGELLEGAGRPAE